MQVVDIFIIMQALGKNRLRKAKDRRLAFDDVLADLKEAVLASNTTPDDVAADLNRRLEFEDEAPDLIESVIASNTFPDDVAADLNRRLELEDEAPDINEAVIASNTFRGDVHSSVVEVDSEAKSSNEIEQLSTSVLPKTVINMVKSKRHMLKSKPQNPFSSIFQIEFKSQYCNKTNLAVVTDYCHSGEFTRLDTFRDGVMIENPLSGKTEYHKRQIMKMSITDAYVMFMKSQQYSMWQTKGVRTVRLKHVYNFFY